MPSFRNHRRVHDVSILAMVLPSQTSIRPVATTGVRAKFNNSHRAAKVAHGALDSAATAHFVPITYLGTDHQDTTTGIRVGCDSANGSVMRAVTTDKRSLEALPDRVGCDSANGSVMRAVATDKRSLEALPDRARDCHKFTDITLPLVSVPQLCDMR